MGWIICCVICMLLPVFFSRELGQSLVVSSHSGNIRSSGEWLEDWNWKISAASRNHLKRSLKRGGFHLQLGEGYSNTPETNTPPKSRYLPRCVCHMVLSKRPWLCSWGGFNTKYWILLDFFHWQQKSSQIKHKDSLWKDLGYRFADQKISMNLNDSAMPWWAHKG